MFCMPFLIYDQESLSIQRAAKAATECRTDGWIQLEEGELQHRRSLVERNAIWQMMQLSCHSPTTHQLINTTTTTTTTNTTTKESVAVRRMDPKTIKTQDLMNIFIAPCRAEGHNHLADVGFGVGVGADQSNEEEGGESQTLQLFPLRSGDGNENINENDGEISVAAMNTNLTPCQFFEFLPLKN